MTSASFDSIPGAHPALAALQSPDQPVRAHLERKRLALADEMRNYPTPIPGCDQQFNGLLDAYQRVRRALQQLDAICAAALDPQDLAEKLRAFDPESLPDEAYPHDTVHTAHN